MRCPDEKILSFENLKEKVDKLKSQGKKVVWTNGCFDILHLGHVNYLIEARKLGDFLIVGLNSDCSARELKGQCRPVIPENHRAFILSGFEFVDFVTIFFDKSPMGIIKSLKPDIYAKGGDYTIDTIDQNERAVVEAYNGEIKILPVIKGESTTAIITRIINNHKVQ